MALFLIAFLAVFFIVLRADLTTEIKVLLGGCLIIAIVILIYAFWLIHNTRYRIDEEGITINFGPARVFYMWSDFNAVTFKKGLFTLKVGWLKMTPCVRLTNAVVLRRENSMIPLFLTPSDPGDFLEQIRQLQPSLVE